MIKPLFAVAAMMVAAGCATKKIETQPLVSEGLPRPNQILVYDFAATADEVPAYSTIAREFSVDPSTQTAEQIATGRVLGSQIAALLVVHLQDARLPARRVAMAATPPTTNENDIVIHGYLASVKEGSATRRVTIGFGAGASELKAAAEVFQVTGQGLRQLGYGTGRFGGAKGIGAAPAGVGAVVIANPAGLIVSSGMNLYGEARGSTKIQARAETAAKEISKVLEKRARELGWIN